MSQQSSSQFKTTLQKHWQLSDRLDADLLTHLLRQRGLDSVQHIDQFFNPSLDQLPSPDTFPQMSAAVSRIVEAVQQQQPIMVWGDFDADGVTSTAILWQTLFSLKANVMPYIPNREDEGHGFSQQGIEKAVQDKVKLIITCDHGITALDWADQIAKQGIDLIISDHHQPLKQDQTDQLQLPSAIAVIHPDQTDIGPLAGCGVAYFLSYAVWLAINQKSDNSESRQQFADQYLELAAIGTIADMVPLTGANRVLAAQGLLRLPNSTRPGLQQLYLAAGIEDKEVFGTYDIGFTIGPRLNAPGRLADALDSLRLLCTNDNARAAKLAKQLNFLNAQRQELLAEVASQAIDQAVEQQMDGVIILANPDWPAGVCGLAAGKVVEKFYRPAVIMEQQGQLSRGSARSIKGFDITAALTSISHLLESFGGHAMAAGFVAKTDNLPAIQQALSELLFQQLQPQQLQPTLDIDAEIQLNQVDWPLFEQLQKFEPCGMANRQPTFVTFKAKVTQVKVMGNGQQHLRLTLDDSHTAPVEQVNAEISTMDLQQVADIFSSQPNPSRSAMSRGQSSATAVAFHFGYLVEHLTVGSHIDLVFTINQNTWNGRSSLQLMVKDLRLSSQDL